jgi:ribonucleoside-diphosphate reductase alpha chain
LILQLYTRRTLAGTFAVPNKILKQKLGSAYDSDFERFLIENRGSVANHPELNPKTKAVFKTAWETKQKAVIDHTVRRAPYIDQAQSRSLYFAEVSDAKLTSALFYAWKKKLKCGVYYTRTRPRVDAAQLSLAVAPACESCSA